MPRIPGSVAAAAGLVGGYGVARWTKKRPLGGAAMAVAGAFAARDWNGKAGLKTAATLTGLYAAAAAGSHPLAKKVGAWPAVFTAAGTVAAAAWIAADRKY
ncbi:hypothetical protein [Streptomyces sp. RPT161]|uniref:hypothetical protein n=1 Tax=Streptomyces sp. RPT161 TaxID=3015993 RepID=UPI0022B88A05|nr:hypothetical protein [Streptomyces sp. RPT161]